MTTVNVYLTFKGNCEEAFNFYKSVFGGDFSYIGRFKDMPQEPGKPIPANLSNKIMHVSLPVSNETVLMGSDAMEGFGPPLTIGNNFGVSITTDSTSKADNYFSKLSAGGQVTMPMSEQFWGAYFGMFTDKYGINWMVSYDKNETANGQKKTEAAHA
jgi:PhnB protein